MEQGGLEQGLAIFENAGQAVHVAFLILSQEAIQDAPLRAALIRVMESMRLTDGNLRDWLDQLRGTPGGAVNFSGLTGGEIRAQCAMITQAVKTHLPNIEMWVLQAKFGQTDFEDSRPSDRQLPAPAPVRRWAFSAERIAAIQGLSDWFAPMFPRIKPLAVDCMLGRLFANHKKLDITSRDIAASFGGNHTQYLRASKKMKEHLRIIEERAIDRLEIIFMRQGVVQYF